MNKTRWGFIVNKLILGLLSTVLAAISWIVFWWLSIIAVVLGVTGLLLKPEINSNNANAEMAGNILSIVGIVVGAIALAVMLIALV